MSENIKTFKTWRDMPEEKENLFADFLCWYGHEKLYYDPNMTQSQLDNKVKEMQTLINEFLGQQDYNQIKQGEAELLQAWKYSCTGEK
jgi:hypothetical protein